MRAEIPGACKGLCLEGCSGAAWSQTSMLSGEEEAGCLRLGRHCVAFSVASYPKQVCWQSNPDSCFYVCVFQRTFISALLPKQSTKMQPVSLHSLSELERASLQELALYQLQEKLLVGDLSLAKGGRGWHLPGED